MARKIIKYSKKSSFWIKIRNFFWHFQILKLFIIFWQEIKVWNGVHSHDYVKTAPKLCGLTRLRAMQLMACSCAMTILKPNLLFMMARRHIIQTWISSVVSPIFNLVECLIHLFIRGPSKSLLSLFFELTVPKITEDFLLDLKEIKGKIKHKKKKIQKIWNFF